MNCLPCLKSVLLWFLRHHSDLLLCSWCGMITWRPGEQCCRNACLFISSAEVSLGWLPHNETLNHRSSTHTSTTNQLNSEPMCDRIIHPVRSMPTWRWEVKKQICPACQHKASFNNVGCRKGRKNPLSLQGMTHTVHHNRLLVWYLQPTHTHCMKSYLCLCSLFPPTLKCTPASH